jgi:TonB family protein
MRRSHASLIARSILHVREKHLPNQLLSAKIPPIQLTISNWQLPCKLFSEFFRQETHVFRKSQKSLLALILAICLMNLAPFAHADGGSRKLKSKVAPQYPELARKMHVSGSVRLEVLVASNGQVKSVKPLGGHPLLIDAAESAVKQWRYEAGPEATEVVEFKFDDQQ